MICNYLISFWLEHVIYQRVQIWVFSLFFSEHILDNHNLAQYAEECTELAPPSSKLSLFISFLITVQRFNVLSTI